MKRVVFEIRECYENKSYDEFVQHYSEMINMGFKPNSDSSRPNYYTNLEMDSYFAEYYKRESNYGGKRK